MRGFNLFYFSFQFSFKNIWSLFFYPFFSDRSLPLVAIFLLSLLTNAFVRLWSLCIPAPSTFGTRNNAQSKNEQHSKSKGTNHSFEVCPSRSTLFIPWKEVNEWQQEKKGQRQWQWQRQLYRGRIGRKKRESRVSRGIGEETP